MAENSASAGAKSWARSGCTAYEIKVPWGCAVRPAQIEDALRKHPDARAVMMQASETSTTAVHPVEQIAVDYAPSAT